MAYMKLLGASEEAWKTTVATVYDKACRNGGEACIAEPLTLSFKRHGEIAMVTLPAGTPLFFPLEGSPQGDRRRAERSKTVCVVITDSVHMTLRQTPLGVEIPSFRRMSALSFA